MSIADVRAAFILAGGGDLSLHDAAMRHVGEGAHVLHFIDPDQRARMIAAELVSTRAGEW